MNQLKEIDKEFTSTFDTNVAKMKKRGKALKKGQFLLCKFEDKSGTNGDIIAGEITSVRRDGYMLIRDMVTEVSRPRTRQYDVVDKRMFTVYKAEAEKVVAMCRDKGKSAGRSLAVQMYKDMHGVENTQTELPLPTQGLAGTSPGKRRLVDEPTAESHLLAQKIETILGAPENEVIELLTRCTKALEKIASRVPYWPK